MNAGIDPIAVVLLSGLIAAIFAVPTAFVVFRLRGPYFAIGSWVVAEVYRLVFAQFKQLGCGTGTSLPPSVTNEIFGIEWVKAAFEVRSPAARDIITYWIALARAAGALLLVYLVLRSRYGLALFAIRDSEAAAESAISRATNSGTPARVSLRPAREVLKKANSCKDRLGAFRRQRWPLSWKVTNAIP